jgi:hypothetical protein
MLGVHANVVTRILRDLAQSSLWNIMSYRESFFLDTVPSNGCLLMGAMDVDFVTPQISSDIHFRS